jgi:hypothetical protein
LDEKETTPALPEGAIRGVTDAFAAPGSDGPAWVLQDTRLIQPDALTWEGQHYLKNGDYLRIFNDAARREVLWEGEISLVKRPGSAYWRGVQEGFADEQWAGMFSARKQALLIPKNVVERERERALKAATILERDLPLDKPMRLKPRPLRLKGRS